MAQNMLMRFSKPRDLEVKEIAVTLDHWITQFKVYAQRDPIMVNFLTGTWNPNAEHMGYVDTPQETAVIKAANCKMFLCHIASFMKVPYYNVAIQTRTTSLESVWQMFRKMYNVEKSADTMINIGTLVYNKSESYASFFAKIQYFIEMNLAPAGITVDHVSTGAGDKLTVTLMDLAAVIWLGKIDKRLYDEVKKSYAVQIKQGTRLSDLVPQISKSIPGMLRNLDGVKNEVVNLIQELNIGHDDEIEDPEGTNTQVLRLNSGFNPGLKRKSQTGAIPKKKSFNNFNKKPDKRTVCAHCNWLRTFMKMQQGHPLTDQSYHRIRTEHPERDRGGFRGRRR